ncbi:hypothetical protein N7454_006288 [Penicillium verhagenii]|nr:hypothetical protein N7454_006288 [Penicillium verhagenii]
MGLGTTQSNLEINLVIVEAKTQEISGCVEKQLFVYWSGTWWLEVREKDDITIHGISTDSVTFSFYCLNQGSKISWEIIQNTILQISVSELMSNVLCWQLYPDGSMSHG